MSNAPYLEYLFHNLGNTPQGYPAGETLQLLSEVISTHDESVRAAKLKVHVQVKLPVSFPIYRIDSCACTGSDAHVHLYLAACTPVTVYRLYCNVYVSPLPLTETVCGGVHSTIAGCLFVHPHTPHSLTPPHLPHPTNNRAPWTV